MKIKTYTLDSFTNHPFSGNPAAVCQLKETLDELMMQQIAQEFNLSETAFLIPQDGYYDIRFFSPFKEIPLCGHATLASAKMLFTTKQMDEVAFKTIEGLMLKCYKRDNQVMMKFPLYETQPADAPKAMIDALGDINLIDVRHCRETNMLLIEMESAERLKELDPDFVALKKSHDSISGLIVTSSGDHIYDFYSRYFWPWSGGNEDPVTGAAHTVLAKYWGDKLAKVNMKAYQSSARGGYMELFIASADELQITSTAVVVHTGDFLLPD
ncbi:PhzF family phenazine biosynthesis protein [Reichenbachiella ulvae]|uniref:PhzF family phenazine biosynthesis protein n=1 Tax=Reichenbachiella ulvae TaxID=2980104 RepID=A0ABT3CUH7_9BACT|nr:PhzF family phenazine biosynthesis protein [Reichenbachiella ulvae]MCV9387214.1 PhzF family phenazine biosynthesis protein [Reichenbachiella ulvae]